MYLISILSVILNRCRGTGVLINFGSFSIGWPWFTKLYNKFKKTDVVNVTFYPGLTGALVYALFFGFMYYLVTSDIYLAVFGVGLFILAESMGWGEWIGSLSRVENWTEEHLQGDYSEDEGKKFPFIHQIANSVCKEQIGGTFEQRVKQYKKYATLALILRGMYWLPVYLVMAAFGVISWYVAVIAGVGLGLVFTLACELSKCMKYSYKSKYLTFETNWEKQEIIYGIIQFICITFTILIYKVYNGI